MTDLELMLITIGDLEFTRRKLLQELQEAQGKIGDLLDERGGKKPEEA